MKKTLAVLTLTIGTLALTACGGMRGGDTLSDAQAQAVGDSIASELESSTASLTASDLVSQGVSSASSAPSALVSNQSAMKPPACVSFTPDPLSDTDGDGVPDTATYTFNCTKTRPGSGTKRVTGQAQLSDPGAGFNLSLTNLETEVRDSQGNPLYTATRSGTRSAARSGSQITLSHDLSVSRQVTGLPAASITNKSSLVFSATGGTVVQGQPLPSGTATVTGAYTWVRGGESFGFALSTPTPLVYDSSCTDDLKIVSGVLRASLGGTSGSGGAGGSVRITFNACGVKPSVLFVAAAS
ncbi:MAG: hypothetical protein SFU83_12635 [Meiothermus sp.]|nr:hypothetical protein [Meiothermus sp.]